MATPGPTKTAVILATPIENVEESRAQRLQRQQARFRDRGGIFVPSSRNTLADILLGKASPLKKRQRSVSASPTRRLSGVKQPRNIGEKPPIKAPRPSKTPQKDARKSTGAQKRPSLPTSQAKGKHSKKVELSDYSGALHIPAI
ncbi:hypothetical protein BJ165DRAFT_690772 [Panaeolus papilionaceus]|nr:hypothetical protein BJ165DRAFT_690772 [Panaeolus papilionaceus]